MTIAANRALACSILLSATASALLDEAACAQDILGAAGVQTDGLGWSAPDDRFSVAFPEGWGVIDMGGAPEDVLAHFGQTTTVVELKFCFVQSSPTVSLDGQDQAALNAGVEAWTADEVLGHAGAAEPSTELLSWDNAEVGGVRVASVIAAVQTQDQTPHFYTRQFVLDQSGAAQFYGVHCIVIEPRAGGMADIEELLASLSFES